MFPRVDECFGFDAECIRDAIDVVEVANHLGRIMDDLVVRTGRPQDIQVSGGHQLRRLGQLFRVFEQCAVELRHAGLAPIGADVVDEEICLVVVGNAEIFDLSTEVVRMRASSVDAVVDR